MDKIETKRLIIRSFALDDASDLHEILGDEETMKNCEPAYDLTKTVSFLKAFCIDRNGAVAAQDKETEKMIGYILFNEIKKDEYEIGWFFNRAFWGRGFAYEATKAVMDHAFRDLSVRKIFAETTDPIKSVGLMKKLGMRPYGIQKTQTHDLYLYGLLREDWKRY